MHPRKQRPTIQPYLERDGVDKLPILNKVTARLSYVNTTDFVAYDERFLDIIGADATVEHVQPLASQSHEAPCYVPETKQLLFVEWGKPGGDNGIHDW